MAHLDITGDASGGNVTALLSATVGFLYRLDLLNATKNSIVANSAQFLTSHRWASSRAGFDGTAFDLNWTALQVNGSVFTNYVILVQDMWMIRRFPIGRTGPTELVPQNITQFVFDVNEDTILYDVDWIFTYWRTEALYRPGFLAAVNESPQLPIFSP